MDFGPTGAQEELRGRIRRFLAEVSPSAEVRRLMETPSGSDPAVWERLAVEMGLPGLHLPVSVGGAGLGWVELAIALEEAGAVLLCAPLLATATAAAVILGADDADRAGGILPAIAAGRCVATLAVAEDAGRWDASGVTTRALRSPGGRWRIEGHKSYVVDGATADLLVVAARHDGGGTGLFLVDGDAPGLARQPLATVDQTRKQARLVLSATPARPLPGVSLAVALDLAAVALAAEQVGGAQRCLDAAVDHAGRRIQFGRPIGSFQAVKHLCADMLLELESARSAAFYAARAAARAGADLPEAAAVAQACCSDAYVRVATDSLHVHGGLGFTWDHDAQLHYKRARSSRQLFGDPGHHRELLARHLGF
ncbi:MAG: acyl-CoA/acyl-ACP dehydrogenase [Actinomycetota bacterium]|nr:acyl-CoA/acyl-ACP dehydrogenase [Actinomycetota bacterium]